MTLHTNDNDDSNLMFHSLSDKEIHAALLKATYEGLFPGVTNIFLRSMFQERKSPSQCVRILRCTCMLQRSVGRHRNWRVSFRGKNMVQCNQLLLHRNLLQCPGYSYRSICSSRASTCIGKVVAMGRCHWTDTGEDTGEECSIAESLHRRGG